jgi:hypothetical protein
VDVIELSPPLAPVSVFPRDDNSSLYDERFTAFRAAVSAHRNDSSRSA